MASQCRQNRYFLIFEIHLLIFEIHFLVFEIHFLVFEIHFLIFKILFIIFKIHFLKPHSYGENLLTCANLHMSRFAHVSKSKFAMRSDENYVP